MDLRLEGRLAPDPKSVTPRCTAGRRAAPPEDCDGPWSYASHLDRQDLRRWEVLDRLAEALRPLLATGDRLALDVDALRDAVDDFDAYQRFQPDRFDRRAVNAALRTVAMGGRGAP